MPTRTFPLRRTLAVAIGFALLVSAPAATPVGSPAGRLPRIEIQSAPPPQREESPARRRPGYVWMPGYWTWTGERYRWMKGRYVRNKPDSFRTVPGRGAEVDGRYRLQEPGRVR